MAPRSFAAAWCEHIGSEPFQICPLCRRCLCDHPAYGETNFWKEAPAGCQKRRFRRLFLLYLRLCSGDLDVVGHQTLHRAEDPRWL
jgi:hypothetical protein